MVSFILCSLIWLKQQKKTLKIWHQLLPWQEKVIKCWWNVKHLATDLYLERHLTIFSQTVSFRHVVSLSVYLSLCVHLWSMCEGRGQPQVLVFTSHLVWDTVSHWPLHSPGLAQGLLGMLPLPSLRTLGITDVWCHGDYGVWTSCFHMARTLPTQQSL